MVDRHDSPGNALSQQARDERRLGNELVKAAMEMLSQIKYLTRRNELMPAVAHAIWVNAVRGAIERIGIDPDSEEGVFLLDGIDLGMGDDAYDMAIEAKRSAATLDDLNESLDTVLSMDAPSMLASAGDVPTGGLSWRDRVKRTVRTGMTGLAGLATQKVLQVRHTPQKQWVTRRDDKVRDTHAAVDGMTIPVDQPFMVGGFPLMYPGDRRGPVGETINCRCVIVGKS